MPADRISLAKPLMEPPLFGRPSETGAYPLWTLDLIPERTALRSQLEHGLALVIRLHRQRALPPSPLIQDPGLGAGRGPRQRDAGGNALDERRGAAPVAAHAVPGR